MLYYHSIIFDHVQPIYIINRNYKNIHASQQDFWIWKAMLDFYAKNLPVVELVLMPLSIMIMHPTTLDADSFAIC